MRVTKTWAGAWWAGWIGTWLLTAGTIRAAASDPLQRGIAELRQGRDHADAAIALFGQALADDPKNVEALCRRGDARFVKGDLTGAAADLDAALLLAPRTPRAHFVRGKVAFEQGDFTGAVARFTRALELRFPEPGRAYQERGRAYVRTGDFERAIADYDRALSLSPKSADLLLLRAIAYSGRDDLARAIADESAAIALAPTMALAYNNRGLDRLTKGELDGALTDLNRALDLDPRYLKALVNRARLRITRREFDLALADVDAVAQIKPDHIDVFQMRAEVSWRRGELSRAAEEIERALAIEKTARGCWLRANIRVAQRQGGGAALEDFTEALRLAPRFTQALLDRARLHAEQGDYAHALADAEAAIGQRPGAAAGYNLRGAYLYHEGKPDLDLADFDRAIERDASFAGAYRNRAGIRFLKRDYPAVVADCSTALRLEPKEGYALDLRSQAYTKQGRLREALADARDFLALAPEDSHAHNRLAWLLATAPDGARLRDGAQAMVHACRACELTNWGDDASLDTLAAACAEAGRYPEAVYWEEKALGLSGPTFGKSAENRENADKRLALYRVGQPYHAQAVPGQDHQ